MNYSYYKLYGLYCLENSEIMNECEIIDTIVLSSVSALAQAGYLILIAELRCNMENQNLEFEQFLKNQDQKFLQKIKKRNIYYHTGSTPRKAKHIAQVSPDGRSIFFLHIKQNIPFYQSFSDDHGIYQLDYNSYTFFIGVHFQNDKIFLYISNNFDDMFKKTTLRIFLKPYRIENI